LLDAVLTELGLAQFDKRGRCDAVAREIAVERMGRPVARPPEIQQQDVAPAATEHERRAQPGRPSPYNDDIDHAISSARASPRA
jgi:hypothetical protein